MKKKKPQKSSINRNPVERAVRNAQPISASLLQDMRLREWSALESFAMGRAKESDARLLLELHCMCLCSIAMGIGVEAQATCDRATEVLTTVFTQTEVGEPMRMDPEQLAVIRELQDLHDQQRVLCNRREYLEILTKADAMIEAKRK